jgi:beta-glucosidase
MMNKKLLLLVAAMTFCAVAGKAQSRPAIPRDAAIEAKIEKTLASMTLDEKIGQMLELNLDVMGAYNPANPAAGWILNEMMLDTCISKYKVGSILNAPGTRAQPVEKWQYWIRLIQEKSMKHIGIPDIYGLDQNHGVTYVQNGTLFPQPINLGASFNTELATIMAQVTAYESRAANCPWVYNPTIDLSRDPRWPRVWESFGEDPLVNGRMAAAEIRGYQGDDPNHLGKYNVATSVKHYMGYGAPFTGKDRTPAYLSPAMLREKYFEPFKVAIQAGALTIMANSASINGVPVHASYKYLTQWLKEDLNWDGMIVTDWADINNLFQREHVAKDKKDAIRIAINAGVDMSMDPYSVDFCILLKELVEEGAVKMSRIDDAVRRILRVKYRLNLFEQPNTGGKGYEKFGGKEHAEKALRAAEETEVLLKNDGNLLPLKPGTRILLTGPNANQMRCLDGGWSYTWQGSGAEDLAEQYNTIYEALCNKYGKQNIILEQGVKYDETGSYEAELTLEIDKAVAAAAGVDVIVACIGENSYCETPGNLSDLWLSSNQRDLVKALAGTGKPIVLILNEGRPRLIADIEPLANAIVHIFLPGNYGADALANLLAGDANFSARLPYTYPKEINSLANYDYKVSEEVPTMEGAYNYDAKVSLQWPFGYGLSYTTFEYSNLSINKREFGPNDILTLTVDVKNTGNVDGKDAVLLYNSDLIASIVPDNKRLRDFVKVELKPGEVKTVTFTVPANKLAFVNDDGKWTIEEGDFTFKVGRLQQTVRCTTTKVWDEPNID